MNDKTIIIKEFLESITDAIGMIDGGCSDCVNGFISDVNNTLETHGLKLVTKDSPGMAVGVEVIMIEKGYPHE